MAKVKKRQGKPKKSKLEQDILLYLYALIVIVLSLIGMMRLGVVGSFLSIAMQYLVGTLYGVIYGVLLALGIVLLWKRKVPNWASRTMMSLFVILLAWILWSAIPDDPNLVGFQTLSNFLKETSEIIDGEIAAKGGIIGNFLYSLTSLLFARIGTYIVIGALAVLSVLLLFDQKKFRDLLGKVRSFIQIPMQYMEGKMDDDSRKKKEKVKEKSKAKLFDFEEDDIKSHGKPFFAFELEDEPKPTTIHIVEPEEPKPEVVERVIPAVHDDGDGKPYELPKMSLLEVSSVKNGSKANAANAKANGQRVVEILSQFGIASSLTDTHIGPSVTKFEIKPESGVRVSRIASLQDDIKMALAAKDIRIEAPIPGKSAVGIEIPNAESTIVKMHELLVNIPTNLASKKLLVALGKNIMGQPIYGELDKMPHLLVAGATGSGKSVCMNAMITSLLMRCTPQEVKLVLVDPKRVEFTAYHGIPHLLTPVINDAKEAANGLKVVVEMMEGRYELFSEAGVRNIATYNEKVYTNGFGDSRKPLPYIVVIIDELADLMMVAAKEVEASIQRITQLARAAGIHLIVATQRPSVDVITGIIKANIPSRIAFAVSSAVDSRTILDQTGAERLLGYGDMLYIPIGEPSATRIQGVYVSDQEVASICEYVKSQAKPVYDKTFQPPSCPTGEREEAAEKDALYPEAKEFVIQTQKASTSLLQRRFGIGYNRAARIIDLLEENSIIGPNIGSKPREVYVKGSQSEEED